MKSKRSRLDKFLCKTLQIPQKQVRTLLINNRVKVDNEVAKDLDLLINEFSFIQLDEQVLQNNCPVYLMLNKPIGVVSATKDNIHKTVIELIDHPQKDQLHIAGRLDLNSSGLLLLTNDSRWSSMLMSPDNKVTKVYQVELKNPVEKEYIAGFQDGFYFEYEGVTTQPAKLEIISEHKVLVMLSEGKYHQIKRMFGRYRNPVVALHRLSIGMIELDKNLSRGNWRSLNSEEICSVKSY